MKLTPGVPVVFGRFGSLPVREAPLRTLDDMRGRLRERTASAYVWGEQTEDSDLDLLVTVSEPPDLREVLHLKP